MKKTYLFTTFCLIFSLNTFGADSWIRVNQLGYLPNSDKRAVFMGKDPVVLESFSLHQALTGEVVFQSASPEEKGVFYTFGSSYVLDFSAFTTPGAYYLKAGNAVSPKIYINKHVYDGTADFALNYMRQQRCGYNPSLDMLCHQHDGYEVYGENPHENKKVDVRGGWHDASDYLQYGTTSSNAIFQMLFAYQMNPAVFGDKFDAAGRLGANGIPDILDEAKWGLDWLLNMYPEKELLYHQIADDRDHASFRLPAEDKVDYGWGAGTGRPVYRATNDSRYLRESVQYGRLEPVTPWMCSDTARHYQWYPFVNIGHYLLGSIKDQKISKEFTGDMQLALESMSRRGQSNPFNMGVPFIWCSNNLVVAMATQCRLYRELSGDEHYIRMENALVDWLFGCNPWGAGMIVGIPASGDYPADPHSALWHNHQIQTLGGLVDGPVYSSIYNSLLGVHLTKEDSYAPFQTGWAVYHDDHADYSTNEPTMDGTASLTYILSAKQTDGGNRNVIDKNVYGQGSIIRTDPDKKRISLVFSGHEFADGFETIVACLKKQKILASFFFTGDFYRNPAHKTLIQELKQAGFYLGAHSDKHLLYCSWEKRDSLLVDKTTFLADLKANYLEMNKFDVKYSDAMFFLPPFEWYNDSISSWCKEVGIQVINYTPGTYSNADYTVPEMKNYYSSKEIYKLIIQAEKNKTLNGNIMLFHIGTSGKRTDKFYSYLEKLINELKKKNYTFVSLNKAVY